MAIAVGISSGGNLSKISSFLPTNKSKSKSDQISITSSIPIWKRIHPLSASITTSNPVTVSSPPGPQSKNYESLSSKIDSWMQESVTEIVKNLKQGPLLVQIFSENEFGKVKIKTEKACLGEWPVVKNELENGELRSPDGLIFVEELDSSERVDNDFEEECEESMARAWGVVVQGKGMECGPVCYLLKTNRVCGGMGLGFCTHFCLMRVKNFRHSAFQQFNDSWLLQ